MSGASVFGKDHGLIHEVVVTSRKAGWTEKEWSALAHDVQRMQDIKQVLLGDAAITVVEHVIDCDAQPFVPDGWSVEEHQKGGAFKWDKETQKDALYLSKGQQGSKYIEGSKLRKELTDKSTPVLNANVLDYLLANPHLIPEEWKGKYVFFWGTVYRRRVGNLYVRYLYWLDGWWYWGGYWLGHDWYGYDPAAVRAS